MGSAATCASMAKLFIGTAGWSIGARYAAHFPAEGTHLERYGARLGAVEINSSFYRPHRRETYERWAASVPAGFRFSVKLPKAITHERRLAGFEAPLDRFMTEVCGLGRRLGVLLVQMPPSLRFEERTAAAFFERLVAASDAAIVCEPRHASWREAEPLLQGLRVARAAADPPPYPGADRPGGWKGLAYFRLHGVPHIYRSDYSAERLNDVERQLLASKEAGAEAWCIFDNTAEGHALGNALAVHDALRRPAADTKALAQPG